MSVAKFAVRLSGMLTSHDCSSGMCIRHADSILAVWADASCTFTMLSGIVLVARFSTSRYHMIYYAGEYEEPKENGCVCETQMPSGKNSKIGYFEYMHKRSQ